MGSFILQRLSQTVLVVLAAVLVSFILLRYVGDPVNNMVGQAASLAEREAMRHALRLNDPIVLQLVRFLRNVATGDLGVSYRFGVPVSKLLMERLPATLELSVGAMLIATLLGVPLGVWTALHRRNLVSQILLAVSLIGVALPTFLIGIVLILIFSVWLGWLPSFGRGATVTLGGGWTTGLLTASGLKSLVLPSLTLGLFQMTLIMRLVRAEMLEVLRTDYIKFARARGLSNATINYDHALRNTLVPVITIVGLQFGNIFAFSIIVETVFQWPGLGLLVIQSIQFADVPLLASYLMLTALGFALINLAVDLLYAAVDPRVRAGLTVSRAGP
ncbi:MAG: ABC transporter permease [Proteobacteria bacterium]|nr:MAG: ABC transporter permease [Pseudomonadota bacterium]